MECYIGQIQLFPYGFVPTYWLPCEGQLLSIQQNQALYALLGTNFGGDGVNNFGIPDLRGANLLPYNKYYMATQGIWPSKS